jgi:hypothetical protein
MPASNTQAQLSFQVCPIVLTGGIASQVPGGIMPMLSYLYASGSALELPYLSGDLDDAFGAFNVLPGGTLYSATIGKYPFANQWVAANAIINEPLTISVIMDAPMRNPKSAGIAVSSAWEMKIAVMAGLQAALARHGNEGGTYTVITPAFAYVDLVLTALTDNSRGNNSLPQNAWRFDFEKPLVTTVDAQGAVSQLLQKITVGATTNGQLTGPQVGSTSIQPPQLSTPKLMGSVVGGSPQPLWNQMGPNTSNYPALPSPGSFPFTGIS